MKNTVYILLSFIVLLSSCKSKEYKGKPVGKEANIEDLLRKSEPKHLAQIYFEHGNFINSPTFPPIVQAPAVLENLDNWLVIDVRSPEAYEAGHINGAYNVPKDQVLDFLKTTQKAAAYPKVVIVCYTGQTASYVTGITRFAGYDNTYAMLFGMAAWNSQFSDPLKKGFGDRYQDMIVKGEDPDAKILHHGEEHGIKEHKIDVAKLPQLPKKLPSLLISERAHQLLKQDRKNFMLKADEFFPQIKEDIHKFYSIYYIPKPKYLAGHIKGSVQFTPRKDLSLDGRLTDIPKDKPVLIYCKTGHTGGNATAYLDMIGYKGHNLIFGAQSFMHSLWKEKGWIPDVSAYINDFPLVEGKKRTSAKIVALAPKKAKSPSKPIVKRKKKEVSGGCG
jgi:rhodanese-related sulfurtransferase